uniref:Uncharacterized protein n=1 Tax=Cyprinus carpio TaxID=7962 RepID=A0A8C2H1R4_CYPCA
MSFVACVRRWTGRSRKLTSTCSVSKEARTCSKLTDHCSSPCTRLVTIPMAWKSSASVLQNWMNWSPEGQNLRLPLDSLQNKSLMT